MLWVSVLFSFFSFSCLVRLLRGCFVGSLFFRFILCCLLPGWFAARPGDSQDAHMSAGELDMEKTDFGMTNATTFDHHGSKITAFFIQASMCNVFCVCKCVARPTVVLHVRYFCTLCCTFLLRNVPVLMSRDTSKYMLSPKRATSSQ